MRSYEGRASVEVVVDGPRFDRWTRRQFGWAAGGTASALLGLVPLAPRETAARKRKKNAFGCLSVGKPCRGKDGRCCSGHCQGKKPKKGKKDKSRCTAHHTGACTAAQDACVDAVDTACNPDLPSAICYRTTGKASFCGNAAIGGCIACRTDTECEAFGFPTESACVVCPSCPGGEGTSCISPGTA